MNWTVLYDLLPWFVLCIGVFMLVFMLIRFIPKLPVFQSIIDGLHPAFVDGLLLVSSTFLTGILTYLATEEAYKYVYPVLLFWLKVLIGSTSSSIQALVAYRSKRYAEAATKTP